MKSATRSSLFVLIGCQIDVLPCPIVAFAPSQSAYHSVTTNRIRHHVVVSSVRTVKFAAINDGNGEIDYGGDRSIIIDRSVPEDIGLDIVRGRETEISDETWSDIEGGAPSQWMVMKDLLGINIFTYMLVAAIVFFLSMNAAFGPGWLGQTLGWENVGTFTKVSESLPLNVDVSASEYLLK